MTQEERLIRRRRSSRNWRIKYPEKSSIASKNWRKRNSERVKRTNTQWRKSNPDKVLAISRAMHLKKSYGLTPEQWDKIYELQKGLCPICEKPIYKYKNPEGKRAAHVDHDHKPPYRVRGLTCFLCNKERIGMNTLATAEKLLVYLASTFDGRKV